jgi:NAD(P)-dependent dehydrogenase (short-subunit alcohol dehydrogenase family)
MSPAATPSQRLAVITGCTSGLGLATAGQLARLGWRVVGISRSPTRGQRMTEVVRAQSGNTHVTFHAADLSSIRETRAVAALLTRQYPQIDLLINNAGAIFTRRSETQEGFERAFALNHLGYHVLTTSLLPLLAKARIVSVASAAHHGVPLQLDDLQMKARPYHGWGQYQQTKLMNILFTKALALRLPATAQAYSLHPGFIATRFGSETTVLWRLALRLMMLVALRPADAARGVLQVATLPQPTAPSGSYYDRGRLALPSTVAQNDELAEALWQQTEALLG